MKIPTKIMKCMYVRYRCPKAFHVNCIPPGARFSSASSCVLCPDHPNDPMPDSESRSKVSGTGSEKSVSAHLNMWDQVIISCCGYEIISLMLYVYCETIL